MPDEGECKRDCEEDTAYKGNNLGSTTVTDLDACFEHCKNIPGAKFLEYHASWQGRWFCKSSDAGRTEEENVISCTI